MKFSPSAKRNLLGQRPHVWKSCSYSIPLHRRALDPHLELQKSLKLRNVSGNVCSTQRRELPIWKEKRRNRFSPNNYTRWKSKKTKPFGLLVVLLFQHFWFRLMVGKYSAQCHPPFLFYFLSTPDYTTRSPWAPSHVSRSSIPPCTK